MQELLENVQTIVQNQHGLAFYSGLHRRTGFGGKPLRSRRDTSDNRVCRGYAEGNRARAALFSAVFVTGLSLTFTLLGQPHPILDSCSTSWAIGWCTALQPLPYSWDCTLWASFSAAPSPPICAC